MSGSIHQAYKSLIGLAILVLLVLLNIQIMIRDRSSLSRYLTFCNCSSHTTAVPSNSSTTYKENKYSYIPTYISCSELERQLQRQEKLARFDVNRLRRQVALTNPYCFEKHIQNFTRLFRDKLKGLNRHVNLHIPKAGGTSVCKLIKRNGDYIPPKTNCWTAGFAPSWCCRPGLPRTSCQSLRNLSKYPAFVMNENYLDVPLCKNRMYSMLLRDPTDRAISMVDNLERVVGRQVKTIQEEGAGGRLNLAQANYMTWSLAVSQRLSNVENDTEMARRVLYYEPQPDDVPLAARKMIKMDFFVDMFVPNWHNCTLHMMRLFGWTNWQSKVQEFPKANVHSSEKKDEYLGYRKSVYDRMNELDRALYNFAQNLLRVDCRFFMQVDV